MNNETTRTSNRSRTARPRRRRRLTPAQKLVRWIHHNAGAILITGILTVGVVAGSIGTATFIRVSSQSQIHDYGRELRYAAYTVKSGDTMWDIAVDMAALNPEFQDVRQYLALLQKTNHNYGDYLQSGTTIMVPYYYGGDSDMTVMDIYAKYNIINYDQWIQKILGE